MAAGITDTKYISDNVKMAEAINALLPLSFALASQKNHSKNIHLSCSEVFEGHQWGVKTLPSNMISCGFSDHGPEIIKHLIRPIIGIQFHPEVTQNQKIFDWIIESLGIKK
jgi:GMP synthase-like glutamine amidotransferase